MPTKKSKKQIKRFEKVVKYSEFKDEKIIDTVIRIQKISFGALLIGVYFAIFLIPELDLSWNKAIEVFLILCGIIFLVSYIIGFIVNLIYFFMTREVHWEEIKK